MDPRSVEDGVVHSPRIGSRLSEIIQNMQKQQVSSTERQDRRPIIVRDIVVAVMGATGAGKSTFIRRVTENDTVVIGFGSTQGARAVARQLLPRWPEDQRHIVPSQHIRPKDVGQRVAQPANVPEVVRRRVHEECRTGTTFWDVVGEDVGTSREAELLETDGFFKDMQDRGCEVVRISNDRDECLQLLARFSAKQPSVMRIQKELFEGKPLTETAAASAVSQELADLQSRNNKMHADVEQQLQRKTMKFELEQAYSLQLDRRAHEEKMGDLAVQQEELRREMSHQKAQSDESLASASRVMSQQNQGYRVELDKLSEQLRALKASSRS
ncbi:hypothetical protein LTR47_005400 [Exophiala xenobiotica]|nr:hypothetical protein LTR41_003139 [Exophiala xenobiotica]KAK5233777.1 hypothetical protein LTR47_005400 [Exophiala xenobiotica]KAK5379768.1 hypothetical protein LTS03_004648 [Exophiala xenobiotica]